MRHTLNGASQGHGSRGGRRYRPFSQRPIKSWVGARKGTIREISMRGFEESRSLPKIPNASLPVAARRLERVPIFT